MSEQRVTIREAVLALLGAEDEYFLDQVGAYIAAEMASIKLLGGPEPVDPATATYDEYLVGVPSAASHIIRESIRLYARLQFDPPQTAALCNMLEENLRRLHNLIISCYAAG